MINPPLLSGIPVTERQYEIIKLVAAGMGNGEIADKLYLSVRTVEGHLYRLFRQFDLTTRAELRELYEREPKRCPTCAQTYTGPLIVPAIRPPILFSTMPRGPACPQSSLPTVPLPNLPIAEWIAAQVAIQIRQQFGKRPPSTHRVEKSI